MAAVTENSETFLGEDAIGWRTALIAAVIAAIIYEVTVTLLRKATLRLPFLILHLGRIGMPKKDWERISPEWRAEIHHALDGRETHWFNGFIISVRYAAVLAVGGAWCTAKATSESEFRKNFFARQEGQTLLLTVCAIMWTIYVVVLDDAVVPCIFYASLALIQARTIRQERLANKALHRALQNRIVIEHAKGLLSSHYNSTPIQAFAAMRNHARQNRLQLTVVARDVIELGLRPPHPSD